MWRSLYSFRYDHIWPSSWSFWFFHQDHPLGVWMLTTICKSISYIPLACVLSFHSCFVENDPFILHIALGLDMRSWEYSCGHRRPSVKLYIAFFLGKFLLGRCLCWQVPLHTSGSLEGWLFDFKSLHSIDLSGTYAQGELSFASHLDELKVLNLEGTKAAMRVSCGPRWWKVESNRWSVLDSHVSLCLARCKAILRIWFARENWRCFCWETPQ